MINGIVVTKIEPIAYHRRRVTLRNEQTGAEYEMVYGDSVSEQVIRFYAPLLASKQHLKRGN